MGPIRLDHVTLSLIFVGVFIGIVARGVWELIDWAFIDDAIRVTKPLVPELELTVKDNVIDTIYVYRKP